MKSTDCAQLDGCTRALVEQVERLELNESRRNCCEKVICAGIVISRYGDTSGCPCLRGRANCDQHVLWNGSDGALKQIIEAFEEKYPQYKVNWVEAPGQPRYCA